MKNTYFVLAIVAVMLLASVGTVSAVTPPAPTVNFTADGVTGSAPFTVTFTATTTGITPPISFEWDFGDNSGAERLSGNTITHTYHTPGKYTVRVAANDLGVPITIWVSNTKDDYITVTHPKPVAGFTYAVIGDNPGYNSPVEIQFTSTTTGFEPELLWDFGDGETTTATNPTHTFTSGSHPEPKPYVINLTATNDGGSDSEKQTLVVNPPKPRADFIATSTTHGKVPLAVQFEDTSVGFSINAWDWNFGDGATSIQENPVHAYAHVGLYDVTLTATSLYGSNTTTRIGFVNVTAEADPIVCPPVTPIPTRTDIGIYKDGIWYLDVNGNGIWNTGVDKSFSFGSPTWQPVKGDWNSDGVQEVGIYKNGIWYLDADGSGTWNAGDKLYSFGSVGAFPIVGDWTGSGIVRIGVYKDGLWYLDINNNGVWDGGATDRLVTGFGLPGWEAVPGNWG
jgi:PKD repeat protein